MRTPAKRGILALALCASTVGTAVFGMATSASAAPAAPTIAVTAQVTTEYLPGSYQTVRLQRLVVHITGSDFAAGSAVRLALLNSSRWQVLKKGSTYAEPATTQFLCGHDYKVCTQDNPKAGTIDFRLSLSYVPAASNLLVLYHSSGRSGMQEVAF